MRRTLLLSLVTIVFFATAAAAGETTGRHLRLVRSEPAQDAAVAKSPEVVQLWFSEAPQIRLTAVQVRGADGRVLDLAKPVAASDDGKHVTAAVPRTLAPGRYTVSWRTLARDGHVVRGEFEFRIEVVE